MSIPNLSRLSATVISFLSSLFAFILVVSINTTLFFNLSLMTFFLLNLRGDTLINTSRIATPVTSCLILSFDVREWRSLFLLSSIVSTEISLQKSRWLTQHKNTPYFTVNTTPKMAFVDTIYSIHPQLLNSISQ